MGFNGWGWLTVAALCGLKFVPGAAVCILCGMDYKKQLFITLIGGSGGIVFFTFFGSAVGKIWRKFFPKKESDRTEPTFGQKMWKKYGLLGTALLTPPVLSPPVGTALALSFGTPKGKLLAYHLASMVLWALIFTLFGHSIMSLFTSWGMKNPDCGMLE